MEYENKSDPGIGPHALETSFILLDQCLSDMFEINPPTHSLRLG